MRCVLLLKGFVSVWWRNRPLHGTKELLIIAINRSLGESMIRQPTMPAALHPNPIHIVNACFPQACAFLKYLSKLNATREGVAQVLQ